MEFIIVNRETLMDAVIFNIDHFHLINEMYGRRTGDEVLKKLAQILTDIFGNIAGIGCRAEADTFYVYCQHQFSYELKNGQAYHRHSQVP